MGRGPRSTRIEHSVHMAMWPHGTSNAERGSSRQTAHGSLSCSLSRVSAGGEDDGSPCEPTGPEGEPTGELAALLSGDAQLPPDGVAE